MVFSQRGGCRGRHRRGVFYLTDTEPMPIAAAASGAGKRKPVERTAALPAAQLAGRRRAPRLRDGMVVLQRHPRREERPANAFHMVVFVANGLVKHTPCTRPDVFRLANATSASPYRRHPMVHVPTVSTSSRRDGRRRLPCLQAVRGQLRRCLDRVDLKDSGPTVAHRAPGS